MFNSKGYCSNFKNKNEKGGAEIGIQRMNEYQNHLTEPPIPVGGYLPKTISDEELKEIIKDQADMCMAILNGDYIEHHEQVKSVLKVIYNWLTKLEEADNE